MDGMAGDLICTQCGSVLDDHLRDPSAEWRDYSAVNNEDAAIGMKRARCGDISVDETKWVGGLMPTKVSSTVYNGSNNGSGYNGAGNNTTSEEKQRLAIVRGRLKRTHNMIENMLEQEQKARYKDVVIERKAREAQLNRGELELDADNLDSYGGIAVDGDYEGLMKQRGDEESLFAKSLSTSLGLDDQEQAYISLKDKKWSLTDAIILYGTLDQVQHWSNVSPLRNGEDEWAQSTLDAERAQRKKKCDARSLNLQKLHMAFTILERAARKLKLDGPSNTTFHEAISWLLKFVTTNDSIRVKGISSGSSSLAGMNDIKESVLSLSLLNGTVHDEQVSISTSTSRSKSSSPLITELHRLKQYAALGSAILYLSAKRTGVGRTLTEVCSAFGTYHVIMRNPTNSGGGASPASTKCGEAEALVRPKNCSRAIQEVRIVLPQIVVSAGGGGLATTQDLAATLPSSPAVKSEEGTQDCIPVKVIPTYGLVGANQTELNTEEAALADLICRMANALSLPSCAISSATTVAIQCSRDAAAAASSFSAAKPCTMPKRSSREQTHIRPRQRRKLSPTPRQSNTPDVIAVASILLVCTAGGTMQRLARQALDSSNTTNETLSSWSSWHNQPSWHRDISQLEQRSGVPRKAIISYYSASLYPRRSYFLGVARKKGTAAATNELLHDIVAAVPLMSLRNI